LNYGYILIGHMMNKENKNLIRCPYCESVNEVTNGVIHCRNCKNIINKRTNTTLNTSWAMLITAMVFYIIANLYPILIISKFGVASENTIIGGVIVLWEEGSYPIAIIIFLASVFTPLMKFFLILYILTNYRNRRNGICIDGIFYNVICYVYRYKINKRGQKWKLKTQF